MDAAARVWESERSERVRSEGGDLRVRESEMEGSEMREIERKWYSDLWGRDLAVWVTEWEWGNWERERDSKMRESERDK